MKSSVRRASEPKTARAVLLLRKAERSRFAGIWLIVSFLPIALLLFSLLLIPQFQLSNATDRSRSTTDAGTDRTADLVLHRDAKLCEHKIFDNRTGRISDAATPCTEDGLVDAQGLPVPTGTAHTLNAISKSFGGR